MTLAGLMHDVGHGPFSHTFDNEIVDVPVFKKGSEEIQDKKWSH